MVKTLYHGSKDIIEHPRYGAGKPYNDYGRGFYCTESLDLAKEWAVAVDRGGFANIYELDCAGLAILDLNGDEYGSSTGWRSCSATASSTRRAPWPSRPSSIFWKTSPWISPPMTPP